MRRVEEFSGVVVLAYAFMSNHFHIFIYVPSAEEIGEGEILRRIRVLYRDASLSQVVATWNRLKTEEQELFKRARPAKKYVSRFEAYKSSFVRRMWNSAEFMRTFKQHFTMSFNGRREHSGTMFEGRYHERNHPAERPTMWRTSAYIDINAWKAGIAERPEDYRWCSFAAAVRGDRAEADRLQDEGRYVELSQLAATLAFLEPHTPEVWSYAAWNLAYNISVMMPTHEDRWRWVLAAIRLLRDDGLALNPGSPELCRELAWLFEIKIGAGIDDAAPLYRRKWREIARDAAERSNWTDLGLDESVMREVASRYGVQDWTDPLACAIYFAHVGLASASGRTRSMLLEIVRQSLWMMSHPQSTPTVRPRKSDGAAINPKPLDTLVKTPGHFG